MASDDHERRPGRGVRSSAAEPALRLSARSVRHAFRDPKLLISSLVLPLCLLAIYEGQLRAVALLPAFPPGTFLESATAFALVQAALLASAAAGLDAAGDVESGFIRRLALTRTPPRALLVGLLAGATATGAVQVALLLAVTFAAGGRVETGGLGVLTITGLVLASTVAFGAVGAAVGLRAGSGEAVHALFPVLFALLATSAALPRELIERDWYVTVASWNPLTYLLDALRSVFFGWDADVLALGFGTAAAITALALGAAAPAVRRAVLA